MKRKSEVPTFRQLLLRIWQFPSLSRCSQCLNHRMFWCFQDSWKMWNFSSTLGGVLQNCSELTSLCLCWLTHQILLLSTSSNDLWRGQYQLLCPTCHSLENIFHHLYDSLASLLPQLLSWQNVPSKTSNYPCKTLWGSNIRVQLKPPLVTFGGRGCTNSKWQKMGCKTSRWTTHHTP